MVGDDDFAAYMAARWPSVVRTLVLLGCGRREAEQVARTGLARCHAAWDRVRRADDVDTYVYAAVLGCLHQHRRRAGESVGEPHAQPNAQPASVAEPTDAVLLRQALGAQLDRLSAEEREVLALRFVADLDAAQVADVLDVPLEAVRARTTRGLSGVDLQGLWERYR